MISLNSRLYSAQNIPPQANKQPFGMVNAKSITECDNVNVGKTKRFKAIPLYKVNVKDSLGNLVPATVKLLDKKNSEDVQLLKGLVKNWQAYYMKYFENDFDLNDYLILELDKEVKGAKDQILSIVKYNINKNTLYKEIIQTNPEYLFRLYMPRAVKGSGEVLDASLIALMEDKGLSRTEFISDNNGFHRRYLGLPNRDGEYKIPLEKLKLYKEKIEEKYGFKFQTLCALDELANKTAS